MKYQSQACSQISKGTFQSEQTQRSYLYKISFPDLKQIAQLTKSGSGFTYQWSYDKMEGYSKNQPNPQYFRLAGQHGIQINIYKDDFKFSQKSDTEPRTQLRGLARIYDNVHYIWSFDQFLVNLPTFDYAWAQIFGGNGPNVIIKWRTGSFQISFSQGDKIKIKFPGNPADLVGKWVNWRIQFLLAQQKGYLRLYKDGILMGQMKGNNSGADNSYIKAGIYCQNMKPSNNVKLYLRNLYLYSLSKKGQN